MLFPDLGDALLPSQKASRTTWVNGLPTIPTAANLAAESISPTAGPGREGNKRCSSAVWYASGCDMTGGADPTYQSPIHHSPPEHTSVVPNATLLHWAYGLPYSRQLWETGP